MRSVVKAAVAALALVLAPPFGAGAQPQEEPSEASAEAAPAPPPAVAAALPDAPVPYTQIRPRRQPARPRPAPAQSPAPAAAPAPAAGALPAVAGLPRTVAGARLSPGQPIPAAELEAFVDGWLQDAMAREHVAGAAISVVQNGQVVLKKGYGFADLEPQRLVDPDRTLFRIGSISKTFTYIALMKQVEAGRIRLDQPVNAYLPEKSRVRSNGYDQPVRVRHLLDHTGGFEDRALGQLFERDAGRVRPLDLYLRQERPRRVRPPGEIPTYSNYGIGLLGLAVQTTNRKGFERVVEEQVLLPLGMTHTTFREPRPERRGLPGAMPQALRPHVSEGYRWAGGAFHPRDYEYIGQVAPAGSASSTAGDMARYMLMLLGDGTWNGVTVFGPTTARAFRTPLQKTPPGINGWAHGFMTYGLPGGYRGFGHGGATLSFHSNMVVVPELNLGIFITTNSENGYELAAQLPDRLVRQFYAAPAVFPRPGSPELARAKDDFAGYYVTTRRTYGGLEGFTGLLMGGIEVGVTPEGRLVTHGQETRTWVPEGPLSEGRFISAVGDERLAFRMADGRAVSFMGAGGAAVNERAPFWMKPSTLALAAGLTAFAAISTLVGLFLRNRRDFRENPMQGRAALVQNIQAGLWLAALVLFAIWGVQASDVARIFYAWPGALVITASTCALVATALTLATIAALPAVWQGGRRVDSWGLGRKVFFTLTVLIYAAFAVILALWGALAPWSG